MSKENFFSFIGRLFKKKIAENNSESTSDNDNYTRFHFAAQTPEDSSSFKKSTVPNFEQSKLKLNRIARDADQLFKESKNDKTINEKIACFFEAYYAPKSYLGFFKAAYTRHQQAAAKNIVKELRDSKNKSIKFKGCIHIVNQNFLFKDSFVDSLNSEGTMQAMLSFLQNCNNENYLTQQTYSQMLCR